MKRTLFIVVMLLLSIFLVSCNLETDKQPETKEYTVTFVTNGGSLIDPIKFENEFDSNRLSQFVTNKADHEFISWHTNIDLSEESIASGTYIRSTTFYAKWEEIVKSDVYYKVTFKDDLGNTLKELSVLENMLPIFGNDPIKPNDGEYSYTFAGWDKEITLANEDKTYIATFNAVRHEVYYKITFKDDLGNILKEEIVLENTLPVYSGNTPTKPSDSEYDYTFAGWDKEITIASEDKTYIATFNAVRHEVYYKITFKDDLGNILKELSVLENTLPIFGNDPIKPSDSEYNYIFAGWDKEITIASEDKVYNAIFTKTHKGAFNGAQLNQIIGFDLYSLLPTINTTNYELEEWEANNDEIAIEIFIHDWSYNQASAFTNELSEKYYYSEEEEAFYVGGAYVRVYEDGLDVYRYLDEDIPVRPTNDDIYFNFNLQDVSNLKTGYGYRENIDLELFVKQPEAYFKIYASQIMNVTDGVAQGLSKGITLAANTSAGDKQAYIEFNALGNNIGSLTFEIQAELNFPLYITDAYIAIYENGGFVKSINFLEQISDTKTLVTINNINSTHFRLVFEGDSTSNRNIGRFMIFNMTLLNESSAFNDFDEAFNHLNLLFNDIDFDSYFPTFSSTFNYQISKIKDNHYELIAESNWVSLQEAIDYYYLNDLERTGFIKDVDESLELEEEVYSIVVSDDKTYNIFLKELNGKVVINVYLKPKELTKEEAIRLDAFESINEYQVNNFNFSGLPSIGDIDVLVVPIEIKNNKFDEDYLEVLDIAFNGTSIETGYESVASFYEKSSFGKLNLNFTITNKYEVGNREDYEDSADGDQIIILEILDDLDNDIDFTNYDFNNDGIIDSIIFIYSVWVDYDSEETPWWAWVYLTEDVYMLDGLEFGYYMWASYHFTEVDDDSVFIYDATTYIHEMGHLMGLTDYYSIVKNHSPLGGFDAMDSALGDHGPLNKLLLGWSNSLIVNKGIYEIELDSFAKYETGLDQILIIPKDYNSFDINNGYSEYLVLMYYRQEGLYSVYDYYYGSPEVPGLVIYHVDATLSSNADFWEMFRRDNLEATSNYFIRILEADLNNSLNGKSDLAKEDILTSGSVNLSSYRWNDNSAINVEIELLNLNNNEANFTVRVN